VIVNVVKFMEVSILRVDGLQLDLNTAGCYVSVDNKLFDVITPLCPDNPEAAIELPSNGQLRLIIKNMALDHDVVGSVSVSLELLPESGFCWLPLYEDLDYDQVTDFDQEFQPPRVLISINEAGACQLPRIEESPPATPVKHSVQHSRTGSIDEMWITKVTELEHKLEEERWKSCRDLADIKQALLEKDRTLAETVASFEQSCADKDSEIARLKTEAQQSHHHEAVTGQAESRHRAQLEERDEEIMKLREVLTELQAKQAELMSHEEVFSSLRRDELQMTLDDLMAQNNELQGLYDQAHSDRLQLEEQLRETGEQLEQETYERLSLERYSDQLNEQVSQLEEELRMKGVRTEEPSFDLLMDVRPESGKDERIKVKELKLRVDELTESMGDLTTQNRVLAEELDSSLRSLKEQSCKVKQLSEENAVLKQREAERQAKLKEAEDAELTDKLGVGGVDRANERGSLRLLMDSMRQFGDSTGRDCGQERSCEGTQGRHSADFGKLPAKADSTRQRLALKGPQPTRRIASSTRLSTRAVSHRRTSTEQLDHSLKARPKACKISYSSVCKEDTPVKSVTTHYLTSRQGTSRKENERTSQGEVKRDHTPSKALYQAAVVSKGKAQAVLCVTPVKDRGSNRITRTSAQKSARMPFK
jgi:hypothetical protein